jgi:hypothetical protein
LALLVRVGKERRLKAADDVFQFFAGELLDQTTGLHGWFLGVVGVGTWGSHYAPSSRMRKRHLGHVTSDPLWSPSGFAVDSDLHYVCTPNSSKAPSAAQQFCASCLVRPAFVLS